MNKIGLFRSLNKIIKNLEKIASALEDKKPEVRTNGDFVRNMTDEELADFLRFVESQPPENMADTPDYDYLPFDTWDDWVKRLR